jgi:hypothetical protein
VIIRTRSLVWLLAVILNVPALVAPVYMWAAIVQTPLRDVWHIPLVFMAVVSLAPVVSLLALIEKPTRISN